MKSQATLALFAAVLAALASAEEIETLNYSGIKPAVYPPDGGCIIVARTYMNGDELYIWDSAPICIPDAKPAETFDGTYKDHSAESLPAVFDLKWAAYGWIYPEYKTSANTGRPGCVWPDAKLDTPCVAEHELLPSNISFPNPFSTPWYSNFWTKERRNDMLITCFDGVCSPRN